MSKGFGNCKWIFEAYASPLRTVEMISNPVEWVGEDVIANALPVSFVPDDVFEVIALPDTGWGEASTLSLDLVKFSLLADASPIQRVDLSRGDRFVVLDDRPKRARLSSDRALGRSIRHDIERIFLIFEGGCFARTGFDKDNPVEMIWHDHPFIKPYVEVGG